MTTVLEDSNEASGRDLQDSCVLITGGTGSFGSTFARKLLGKDVAEVRVLSRDEAKQDELRRELRDPRLRCYVGDVRDIESVRNAVRGATFVFHAAALKQVPSCEFFPQQAVATNVTGSDNVIRASSEADVTSVVCLSTDKAVYPVNAMGMSKAMMERIAQAHARNNSGSRTVVSVVRYGNVMLSRGSVIPLFVQQMRKGMSLTVTDPNMTRFLMSLEQSVALVEFALRSARPGDLFVRKAPAATVQDLARAVGISMGYGEVPITVIGTRHGEKLFETLLTREERAKALDCGDYFRVPMDQRSLNYEQYFSEGAVVPEGVDEYTSHNTTRLSVGELVDLLKVVPEMQRAVGLKP